MILAVLIFGAVMALVTRIQAQDSDLAFAVVGLTGVALLAQTIVQLVEAWTVRRSGTESESGTTADDRGPDVLDGEVPPPPPLPADVAARAADATPQQLHRVWSPSATERLASGVVRETHTPSADPVRDDPKP